MKPLFALILCVCLLALCACGQAEPEEVDATTTAATTAAPTTTEAPTKLPIEYPASYRDAPEAYKPILDDLYRAVYLISNNILNDNFYGDTGISVIPRMFFGNDGEFRHGTLGYAVKDINKDGMPELLLLTSDCYGSKEQIVLSLFTLGDNKPIHLYSCGEREWTKYAADGTIYTVGSGGAATTYLAAYKLEPGAADLTKLPGEYMSDWGPVWYEFIDDEQEPITEEEFNALHEKYSNPPNPMQFNFIPIEQ